jgi:MFS transporter, PPP family, 3-phenylpropionic acid transporter
MEEKSLNIRLNTIYFIFYAALAGYYPFLTVYLVERGLSYTQIGIAYAITSLISVATQPVWGYITDKYSSKNNILFITMLLSSLIINVFVYIKGFPMVMGAMVILVIFQSPISSILDAYTYDMIEEHRRIQFGRIRLMGSIGYAVFSLLIGILIKATNINSSFYVYFIMLFTGVFVIKGIKFKGKSQKQKLNFNHLVKTLKNKNFIVFLFSICIMSIALGVNGSYISVLIEKTGGNVSNLGLLWFIVAMSELPVFFFGGKLLKKYGELNVFIFAILIYILRFFLDGVCINYTQVIFIQLLQGISFPLYLMASLQYLNKIVPSKMRTSGITLYAALGGGLGGFIGNIMGGKLLDIVSVFVLFKVLSIIMILALLVVLVLKSMFKDAV